jgi:hypothetical protein
MFFNNMLYKLLNYYFFLYLLPCQFLKRNCAFPFSGNYGNSKGEKRGLEKNMLVGMSRNNVQGLEKNMLVGMSRNNVQGYDKRNEHNRIEGGAISTTTCIRGM